MKEILRGNFDPKKKVDVEDESEDLSSKFEREALKRLGGSIAFVSKKKLTYGLDDEPEDDAESDATTQNPDA